MSAFPIFQTTTANTAQLQFSLKLLQQVAKSDDKGPVALSPLGVLAALALVLAGSDGPTQAAFQQVLFGATSNPARAEKAFADWLRQLLDPGQLIGIDDEPADEAPAGALLQLATSLWADQHFAPAPDFVARMQTYYDAEVATLDFMAPTAAPAINEWVRQHTAGKIESIVSEAALRLLPPPQLMLLNAVYFNARWAYEFDPEATRPGLFRRADGTTQAADLMHQVSEGMGYLARAGWQAVSMPYLSFGRGFSMLVFLPDSPDGLPAFLAGLDAGSWDSWHKALRATQGIEVDLTFPRLRLEWSADLVPVLRELGLGPAFAPGADFSALGYRDADGGGFIGAVLHKTFLQLDEVGTEAAAVTAIMCAGGGPYEPEPPRRVAVRIDSPFLYAIVDDQDGTLLFAGTVSELT
ncbi:serpin family protein [Hymenobacter sp. M29]|uniref:Serpin family protein n=1 Tax=Hymenobacter mellowenesis TaxID=3063995 RepID=A0ABT9A947_9BACT|nr:serpin family protein [Hymenobacter sp. M29]MDO7845942.1 serpin family protein [Hymenobacter sp. M29]